MADRLLVTSEPDRTPVRRTAWSAVFAGALVALMSTFLLSLLAAGVPASEQNALAGYGTGSVVALAATSLIALFLGGWVTGYLAGLPRRGDAFVHGVLTVSLLTTAVGGLLGGATSLLGGTISSLSQGAAAASDDAGALAQLPGVDLLQSRVDQALEQAGVQDPEQAGQELVQLVTERVQAGESLTSPAAQEELKTFLAQNSDLTEAGIDQQVRELGQQLDETQQQVAAGAEQAAGVSGLAALGTSAALLVGALIAALGAAAGSPKRAYTA